MKYKYMMFWYLLLYHCIQKNTFLLHSSFSDLSMLSPVSLFSSSRFLRTRDWILCWYSRKILAFQLLLKLKYKWRDLFFGITPMSRGQFIYESLLKSFRQCKFSQNWTPILSKICLDTPNFWEISQIFANFCNQFLKLGTFHQEFSLF